MRTQSLCALLAALALALTSFGLGVYTTAVNAIDANSLNAWFKMFAPFGSGIGTALALTIAYHANKISRETSVAQLRPYVFIQRSRMYNDGAGRHIACEYKNVGLTPAMDVRVEFYFAIAPPAYRIPEADLRTFTKAGVIAPAGIGTVEMIAHQFSADDQASVERGDRAIFMRCRITYSWPGAKGERDGFDVTSVCDKDYFERGLFRNVS